MLGVGLVKIFWSYAYDLTSHYLLKMPCLLNLWQTQDIFWVTLRYFYQGVITKPVSNANPQ